MKALFVSLVALLFAFFIGCQNSLTDPIVPDQENTAAISEEDAFKDAASTYPGFIELNGNLFDQLHPGFDVQIAGVIKYNTVLLNGDLPYMKVYMYINADLKSCCPGHNQHMKVLGMTEDILYTPTKILEKSFEVRNTCKCHYKLVLRFKVNQDGVFLISKELKAYGGCYANTNVF